MELEDECKKIITCFQYVFNQNLDNVLSGNEVLSLPKFPIEVITELCKSVSKIFGDESIILKINHPVIIVGDIHGHLLDLARIFIKFGMPPYVKYLFLGDIVDRGEFSLETLLIIYALKFLYPSSIYLIRGNHEFLLKSCSATFGDEFQLLYPGSSLFQIAIESFYNIPLAAIVFKENLCIHAGLSPELLNIEDIYTIQRPIKDCTLSLLVGLLWSDPTNNDPGFSPSRRGTGFQFGYSVFMAFMEANGLKRLIRGHECVIDGHKELFDGRLITIFSASNYCGVSRNSASVLMVNEEGNFTTISMLPLQYLQRSAVQFVDYQDFSKTTALKPNIGIYSSLPILNAERPMISHFNSKDRLKTIVRHRRGTNPSFLASEANRINSVSTPYLL